MRPYGWAVVLVTTFTFFGALAALALIDDGAEPLEAAGAPAPEPEANAPKGDEEAPPEDAPPGVADALT